MSIGKSQEDYLEAIYLLSTQREAVRSVDVARYLGVTKASVSAMLSALAASGYVEKAAAPTYALTLTSAGTRIAEQTYERHCYFRDLLTQAGVEEEVAEHEACEMEHTISANSFLLLRDSLEEKMKYAPAESAN